MLDGRGRRPRRDRVRARRRRRVRGAAAHSRRQAARPRAPVRGARRGGERRGRAVGAIWWADTCRSTIAPRELLLPFACEDPELIAGLAGAGAHRRAAARAPSASWSTSPSRTRAICSRKFMLDGRRDRGAGRRSGVRTAAAAGAAEAPAHARLLRHLARPGHRHGRPRASGSRTAGRNRAEYRKFKVKTVEGHRRLRVDARGGGPLFRAGAPKTRKPLPDLVVIDGGKGQLGAAHDALVELGLGAMPLISLAKREEEIFVLGRARVAAPAAPLAGAAHAAAGAGRGAPIRDYAFNGSAGRCAPSRRRCSTSPASGRSKRRQLLAGVRSRCRACATRTPEAIAALPGFSQKTRASAVARRAPGVIDPPPPPPDSRGGAARHSTEESS